MNNNYNLKNRKEINILLISKGIEINYGYLIIAGRIKKNLIYY